MAHSSPEWNATVLVAVARGVLATITGGATGEISQRTYDAARIESGHGRTPRASQLARWFGVSWPVLARIVATDANAATTLARVARKIERPVLTRAEATSAIVTVARCRATDTLSPADYETTRAELNARLARRCVHGRHVPRLPSLDVIRERHSFPELVAHAGLAVAKPTAPGLLPRFAAITLFVEHHGFLPSQLDLRWFARTHAIQLVARDRERHGAACVAARDDARARERWFPPARPCELRIGWRDEPAEISPALAAASRAYPAPRKAGYSLDEVRDALRTALDLLGPGQALTQRNYRALSVAHGLPSPSVIQRLTTRLDTSFGALVREVATERVAAQRVE